MKEKGRVKLENMAQCKYRDVEELGLGRPTEGRYQTLEAIPRNSAGWWYREGVPETSCTDIECMSETDHPVLNLDVWQLIVKSVLEIRRMGKDDR